MTSLSKDDMEMYLMLCGWERHVADQEGRIFFSNGLYIANHPYWKTDDPNWNNYCLPTENAYRYQKRLDNGTK